MGLMNRNSLGWCLALSAAGALGAGLAMAEPNKVPLVPLPAAAPAGHLTAPKALPTDHFAKPPARPVLVRNVPLPRKRPHQGDLTAFAQANVALRGSLFATRAVFKPMARPVSGPFAIASTTATSPADVEQLKQVLEAARKGRDADADAAEKAIVDPVARKLAEWMILRSDNTNPTFQRYAAFVTANPAWPHVPLFRRRAENALWNDHADDATVLAFFAHKQPTTAKGRYVLAHALLAKGDRAGAAALVRHAWRQQDASVDVENRVLEMFGDLLTRADHKVRMEQRLYRDDIEAGMRAAKRLGGSEIVLAKARAAVIKNLNNAKALLDDVPAAARQDAGYIFARAQWLRKNKKPDEAEKLILTAPQDPEALVDLNQWWLERRILVRQLLDENNPKAAYLVALKAAPPTQANWRVDKYFTAGWIALRFLHDPKAAAEQFAHINDGTANPHALSRGGYWQGRAAEAMGRHARRQGVLRDGGQIHRHLLRAAGARAPRAEGHRPGRAAVADRGGTHHARQSRSRARGRTALQA